jgi:metal-responsive CopG/Arc/MetJ family transcriptional regulator
MNGMTERKVKVSVSLDAALIQAVDRAAAKEGTTRSALMERWLRNSQRQSNLMRLEEETAAYYDSLTLAETDDDSRWAEAATRSARSLKIDGDSGRARPKRTGRRRKG